MYNSNTIYTNSLIIVGAHLMKKKKNPKGIMYNLFPWLIWFILSKNLAFFFFSCENMGQPEPACNPIGPTHFNPFKMAIF